MESIRIYPDRSHGKTKSKHENFNSKNPPDPLRSDCNAIASPIPTATPRSRHLKVDPL
jgi:hypothetical protein